MQRALGRAVAVSLVVLVASCADVTPKDAHALTRDKAQRTMSHLAAERGLVTRDDVTSAFGGGVMSVEEREGGGFDAVVRYTVSEGQVDGSDRIWHGCWRYGISPAGGVDSGPDPVACTDGEPLTLPPTTTTVPPTLGDQPDERAKEVFESFTAEDWSDTELVHETAAAVFVDPTATIEVIEDHGVTGLAVGVEGDCLMLRSEPFEVWMPYRVYRSFGGATCNAQSAAFGEMQRAPH
ncbi:MAG: hypothetical protein KF906_06330 [Actinobacteria bacterium]|nr:hypothetical protein [Actinomycetota bacterium]